MELTVCVSTDQPLPGGITNNEQDTQEEKMIRRRKRKRKGKERKKERKKEESVREKNQKRNKKKKKKQPTQKIEFSLTAFSRVFLPNQRAERGFPPWDYHGTGLLVEYSIEYGKQGQTETRR